MGRVDHHLVRVVDVLDADLSALVPRYLVRLNDLDVPIGTDSPEMSEALARGAMAAFRDILARLRTQSGPPTELPTDIAAMTRVWARAGRDFASLIDVLTRARAHLWEELERAAEAAVGDAEARWALFTDSHRLTAGYRTAVDRLAREASTRNAGRRWCAGEPTASGG